ncbi:haloacid dehalogenase type II [Pararhizobium arenae]|uniref:haloacid dehalogenase type II n=1 Tax=Pararhizobium arenae TaxID=1856850 RepID=UPI00094B6270|nr:haloacid dehalogenase type II [Pararhizobium arenae]
MSSISEVRLLAFDVFGTVVDWRNSVARHVDGFFKREGLDIDALEFATDWRSLYQPAMEPVRNGSRQWVTLDILNFENLEATLIRHGVEPGRFGRRELDDINRAWERLDPWPDSVEAIKRLKKKFAVATMSNGHIAGMLWLSKYADLHWDAILGAEMAENYKPHHDVYRKSAERAGLTTGAAAMVAAHNDDLLAAQACGLKTIFIHRREEHGPLQTTDLVPEGEWTLVAESLGDLADQLGC